MYLQETLVSRHKMRQETLATSRQKLLQVLTIAVGVMVAWHYGSIASVGSGLKLLVAAAWKMLLDLVTVLGHFWDHVLNVRMH